MIFDQPKDLEQFVRPAIASPKEALWIVAKLLLPVVVLCFVIVAESRALKGLPVIPGLIGLVFCFPVFIVICWLAGKLDARFKRTLQIEENYIRLRPCQQPRLRWRHVLYFQVEPAGPRGEFKKITIQFKFSRRQSWSIVLADTGQFEILLSELWFRKEVNPGTFGIEIFKIPIPPLKRRPVKTGAIWLLALAALLIVHGGPLLAVGLLPPDGRSRNDGRNQNPRLTAWIQQFAKTHNLRRSMIIAGSVLTGAGAASVGLSVILTKRDDNARRAEILENENIARGT
jgi:hypothetical protein